MDVATFPRGIRAAVSRVAPITNAVFRRHWPFAVVVAAAALVRIGVAVAYRPALFYSDSWAYVDRAWCCTGVAFTSYPPSGYPALMQLLSPVGRQLALITSTQHLAGLLVGVILYALLLRAGLNRIVAALAAAVVLLDAYSIALEQHIMAEPFFTLALTASAYFATDPRRSARAIAASGLLLGAAVTMRAAAALSQTERASETHGSMLSASLRHGNTTETSGTSRPHSASCIVRTVSPPRIMSGECCHATNPRRLRARVPIAARPPQPGG